MSILDNPIWNSLETRHARFAEGSPLAKRFHPDVSPFAATPEDGKANLRSLGELPGAGEVLMLLQRRDIAVPPGFVVKQTGDGVQMVAPGVRFGAPPGFDPLPLGPADAPEMIALATLTKPGPFLARTHELSQFVGIRHQGALVAMAGERLQHPGYSEVSGVCTHPDARGQGLARKLSMFVAARIVARGETPYLHAYASNEAAVALYESLGFRIRCPMQVAVL